MNGFVNHIIERGEWSESRGDWQALPDINQPQAGDLIGQDAALQNMVAAKLGQPIGDYDVRSTYDSRPVNGYDFNFSVSLAYSPGISATPWVATFIVPTGYRAVPREWEVSYDAQGAFPESNSTVSVQQAGANVPNNQNIIIGNGTTRPIKTFFVCEENTSFGMTGNNIGSTVPATQVNVKVYGNLIPVTDVSLPYCIANRRL